MDRCKFADEVTGYIYVARCSCEKHKLKYDHLATLKYCVPEDCKFYEKGEGKGEGVRNEPVKKEERTSERASGKSGRVNAGKKNRRP